MEAERTAELFCRICSVTVIAAMFSAENVTIAVPTRSACTAANIFPASIFLVSLE